jgi:hypothetical protein
MAEEGGEVMSKKRPPISIDVETTGKRDTVQAHSRIKGEMTLRGRKVAKISFWVPIETLRRLHDIRNERSTSLQQLMEEAVDQWLVNQGAPFSFLPNGEKK